MIYPTIQFNSDSSVIINIFDTEFDTDPVLSIKSLSEDSMDNFYTLLNLFLNQYINGFNDGYEKGFDDAETEGDIMYGNYDFD